MQFNSIKKLIGWLDNNLLAIFSGFLLAFIPLYPKLPLFDVLPGYIVRVRLEDFVVFFCIVLWISYFFRGKVNLKGNPLFIPILLYLIIAVTSMFSAVFITKTIPYEIIHIQKMVLHFLRRIEYFSLFFIFFSSIQNLKSLKTLIAVLVTTVLLVSLYGFGQRYLYWPAFSTMNREFAKGWMLYLTEHARVLSTFGGHYDLAAFIMMALIFLWSIFFGIKKIHIKILIILVLSAAFWTLILTASRTSFIAYLVGLTFMFFFWSFKKGIIWSLRRWFTVVFLSIFIMLSFGDLSERFTKLLKIDQRVANIKSLLLSPIGKPPSDKAIYLENNPQAALSQITSKSDQPPSLLRPIDVYQDIPLNVEKEGTLSAVSRTYSKTAFMYDLSTAIRFDALWPRAIAGFKRNMLLGSGYSTLNKLQNTEFTEAESTDNDYLRALGETGLLGFIAFYGTLAVIVYYVYKNLVFLSDNFLFSISVGLVGILFGLLTNAIYIDVFESSKVAFSFWGLTGLILGSIKLAKKDKKIQYRTMNIPDLGMAATRLKRNFLRFFKSEFFYLLLILGLAFYLRLYKIDTPLADWHSWRQADTAAVTRNYVKHGINILYPTYNDLSNVASGRDNPKGLRYVEFPLYNIFAVIIDKLVVGYNLEIKGRLANIFATIVTMIFLFYLVKKYSGKTIAYLAVFFFGILPFSIYYTRTILPEPFLILTSTGMLLFFDKFVEKLRLYLNHQGARPDILRIIFFLVIAILFTSSALLIKPYAGFLFPILFYIYFREFKPTWKSILFLSLFFVIISLPFVWWRWWMGHFPEGIPANLWLLDGDNIRFKGAFFYWIFADRIAKLILGYWGVSIFVMGIVERTKKDNILYNLWGLGLIIYLFVFATGNVRHDYYQILLLPYIAIILARGAYFLIIKINKGKFSIRNLFVVFVVVILMEMLAWYHVRDFFNINHPEIVEAGKAVEKLTSDKALVIAPYGGDTAFLYQTNRSGWPILQDNIAKLINMGATHFVSTNFDDTTKTLIKESTNEDVSLRKYKILEQNSRYVLIQLVPDNKLPR